MDERRPGRTERLCKRDMGQRYGLDKPRVALAWRLHQQGVADESDGQAFDGEALTRFDDDGGVIGVFGQ
jgi:hypothetical protein